jgi:hypothetical protein
MEENKIQEEGLKYIHSLKGAKLATSTTLFNQCTGNMFIFPQIFVCYFCISIIKELTNSSFTNQEMLSPSRNSRLSWDPKIRYHIHRSPIVVPAVSQMNSCYNVIVIFYILFLFYFTPCST